MYIVIVSSWLRKIKPILEAFEEVTIVKEDRAKLFIYYNTDQSYAYASNRIKKYIRHYLYAIYVFEVYGMFNGKIDIIDYLPPEMKLEKEYYQSKKDLTEEEEDAFYAAHPELPRVQWYKKA